MIDLTDVRVTVLPHGEGLALPAHAEPHAAGLDLRAAVPADAPLTLAPGAHALVPTGLQIVGNPCDDKAVFRVAQGLENAMYSAQGPRPRCL